MTKIVFFFGNWIPTFLTIGFIGLVCKFYNHHLILLILLAYVYLLPVALYRIMHLIFRKKFGKFKIESNEHLLWWYGMQLQALYARFSFFEEFLRIFPMLYSAWLRLWGAKLGKFIFWSPKVFIADRGDIEIDDLCVIGWGVKITAHLISKSHHRDIFLYSKIKIGKNVIVGAESNLGPGVEVGDNISIAALSTLLPFSSWKNSKEYSPKEN